MLKQAEEAIESKGDVSDDRPERPAYFTDIEPA